LKVSFDDLANHLADKFHIEPISLLKDDIHIGDSGDTTVDMSHDFRYGGGATHVPATFAEFVIPFTGDVTIFRLRLPLITLTRLALKLLDRQCIYVTQALNTIPLQSAETSTATLKILNSFFSGGVKKSNVTITNSEKTIRQRL